MKKVHPKQFASKYFGNKKALAKVLNLRVYDYEIVQFHKAFSCSRTEDYNNVSEYMSTQSLIQELQQKMSQEVFKETHPFIIHAFTLEDLGRLNFLIDMHIKEHMTITDSPADANAKVCQVLAENLAVINNALIEYTTLKTA